MRSRSSAWAASATSACSHDSSSGLKARFWSIEATARTPVTRSSAIIGIQAPLFAAIRSTSRGLVSGELATSNTVTGAASNTALAIPDGSLRRSTFSSSHQVALRPSTSA